MENRISKNNKAWNELFAKYNIIQEIEEKGFFEIIADQIKTVGREPRLMTKFDSSENLPSIFVENNLAILPISRGSYIIGTFKNYQKLELNNTLDVQTKYLPNDIATIDYKNITSEAVSLNSAYISGMIEEIVGEKVLPTLQGRMTTGTFSFQIAGNEGATYPIQVKNAQMEIDASYEGKNKFVLLEAKNHYMNDFIIRQLYYPYRVLKKLTDKQIIPMILIKHDAIFNFFIYEFLEENNYNSIRLKEQKRYILDAIYHPIEAFDIQNIMDKVEFVKEDKKIPFPQANSFYRVLDLLNELNNQDMSAGDVTELYGFDLRQANYYLSALQYLGFVVKDKNYRLSKLGTKIEQLDQKEKTLAIIKCILSHKPFYFALVQYQIDFDFTYEEIAKVIYENRNEICSMNTAMRRTSTVVSWVKWILEITTIVENHNSL